MEPRALTGLGSHARHGGDVASHRRPIPERRAKLSSRSALPVFVEGRAAQVLQHWRLGDAVRVRNPEIRCRPSRGFQNDLLCESTGPNRGDSGSIPVLVDASQPPVLRLPRIWRNALASRLEGTPSRSRCAESPLVRIQSHPVRIPDIPDLGSGQQSRASSTVCVWGQVIRLNWCWGDR